MFGNETVSSMEDMNGSSTNKPTVAQASSSTDKKFSIIVTNEESKTSTDVNLMVDPPLYEIANENNHLHTTNIVNSRRPSNNSTTSSMIHPIHAKPHPIYGRRDTIFTFDEVITHLPEGTNQTNQQQQLPSIEVNEKQNPTPGSNNSGNLLFGYCGRGVRISHVLLILFIIQGLVGLVPSLILMYTSGNSILERVSKFQAQQTQTYVNFEISRIVNTSQLVIQHIRFELENGFTLSNLTEMTLFATYLRNLYVNRSPLTAVQFGMFMDNYVGTLDIPPIYPPVIEYLNGTGDLLYHYRLEEDSIENPLQDRYLYNVEPFRFKPSHRPWYVPFTLPNATERRWSEIYVSTFGQLSINTAMPVFVKENITAAVLSGKPIDQFNFQICDCNHPDHLYGVFGALFALKGLNSFLNDTSRPYSFISYSFIMQRNGSVIASSRHNTTTSSSILEEEEEIDQVAAYIINLGLFKNSTIPGECTFKFRGKNVAITPVYDNYGLSWAIVIGSKDADILKELLSSGMTSVVVFIVILVAGSLALFVTVQLFAQPLNNVHRKLSKILSDKNLSKDLSNPKITTAGLIFFDIGEMENGINSLKRGVSAFSKFISPTIMKKVIRNEHYLDVGMIIQNMSILVLSISNFSQLAEQTDISTFVSLMTDYFGSLTKVMEDHRGLIDMITGERLQVVWNDSSMPVEEHEVRACKAAMEAIEVVEELNNTWIKEKHLEMDFSVCMSISSGNMMYGSIGSEHRLNFTAMGDDVNIAVKLANLNPHYEADILITENTYQHVKNEFVCYFVDYIILNGKESPTMIYSLECERSVASDLQVKVATDLELARNYWFQNNYRAMYDICERLSLISHSKIINNLLLKAKRKITHN
ncbi:predicted protein [Naegleria gruberi]|uniref:Predicted protein n=1 Tax=Naegleria gruberi TaxID=5762 RepID=D2V3R6_NAEGR|nr:uncharacterized protein NAEGRDRAFT_63463 [Naegleria gruberi]EFC48682.1 predicted protein [Naegleria gruberi]|eukprot:XP_002681426.1 predicted protein [Naegleria gruberi strain NEG-M]